MEAAARGVMTACTPPSALYRISMTETTLSFAIKPLIRDVTILQSPRPKGVNIGAITPATVARILSREFSTM